MFTQYVTRRTGGLECPPTLPSIFCKLYSVKAGRGKNTKDVKQMVRKKLEQINDKRSTFTGIVDRFGIKNGYKGPERTVLLKDIKDISGKIVTNHLWFNLTKGFSKLNLKTYDVVKFDARVTPYVKGYKGHRDDVYAPTELDYKLSYPTKIKVV